MKTLFFISLFSFCISGMIAQSLVITTNPPQSVPNEVLTNQYTLPKSTEPYFLVTERGFPITHDTMLYSAPSDLVWYPISDYTIFHSGLNLSVFEKEVQIRYSIYEIAAESAISGDAEAEGVAWFIIEHMKEPDFAIWYTGTLPAMLDILSIPESSSKEDIGIAEKMQRLKKRLFPGRE